MKDIRQSANYSNYLQNEGWTTIKIRETVFFLRKIFVLGTIIKVQRPENLNVADVFDLAKKHKAFQIIVEPKNSKQAQQLIKNGFKLNKSTYLPSKTLQIDLTAPTKTIFSNLKKDARHAVKRGGVYKIKEYSTINEIKKFHESWKKSVKIDRYVPSLKSLINLKKSFPQKHSLFVASHNISSRIIGGAIFTVSSHGTSNYITYYWYGFTNKEGRTSLSQYSLLYYGILWAKQIGCKLFDFEGIYDTRFPNKSWLGFTHFKKSFGGKEVEYPGTYSTFRIPYLS